MNNFTVIVAVLSVVFGVGAHQLQAQTYHNDGGVLVVEDTLLSTNHKTILFVVARDINQSVRMEMQTYALMEGIINQFQPRIFPEGVRKGQKIAVWDGNFNQFHSTAWLYFTITMTTSSDVYYTNTMFPVNYREQYKEPMITSIAEEGGYTIPYTITVRGVFDTTIPSLVLINSNLFVSPRAITQTRPGVISFTMPSGNFEQFPSGKYLLTICQAGHCDTLQGRHR